MLELLFNNESELFHGLLRLVLILFENSDDIEKLRDFSLGRLALLAHLFQFFFELEVEGFKVLDLGPVALLELYHQLGALLGGLLKFCFESGVEGL